jgi:hypothetical protein
MNAEDELDARLAAAAEEIASLRAEVQRRRARRTFNDAAAELIQRQADATTVEEIEAAGEELDRLIGEATWGPA